MSGTCGKATLTCRYKTDLDRRGEAQRDPRRWPACACLSAGKLRTMVLWPTVRRVCAAIVDHTNADVPPCELPALAAAHVPGNMARPALACTLAGDMAAADVAA